MRKPVWSLLMIAATVLASTIMIACRPSEKATEVRIVRVQSGDVRQVVALTGRLTYTQEEYVMAPSVCSVERICVESGQRVAAGEALIRLSAAEASNAVEAVNRLNPYMDMSQIRLPDNLQRYSLPVLRAPQAATVRQIYIKEGDMTAAGAPLIRLSAGAQEIICSVAQEDAGAIAPDMWGWVTYGGEPAGFAKVAKVSAETVEPATGLTYVSVSLQPEQHLDIPEGAAVDAELFIAGSDDVETLPVEAITERGTVWWIADNRCTEIPANVVLTDEILAWVELPEGLPVAIGEYKEGMCVQEAEE